MVFINNGTKIVQMCYCTETFDTIPLHADYSQNKELKK